MWGGVRGVGQAVRQHGFHQGRERRPLLGGAQVRRYRTDGGNQQMRQRRQDSLPCPPTQSCTQLFPEVLSQISQLCSQRWQPQAAAGRAA